MLEQDNLISFDKLMKNIDINEMKQYVPTPVNINMPKAPEVIISPNPIHETNRILEEQSEKIDDLSDKLEQANFEISKQTKELQSIHYENIKLNAQIDILNKTIDSQNNELENLKNINVELKITNHTLEENNKHSTRNAIILAIGTGIVLIAIEHWYDIYLFILHQIK